MNRYQARPIRGPQWAVAPTPSRWRVAAKALAVLLLLLSTGIERVTF